MGEFKKAFTLAEIMIVLVIIGVITAILLPVAIHSAPDENVMKFKKGNNTLGVVIRELVNSDQYYANGDLGMKPDGTLIDGTHDGDVTYFCQTFADVVSTKKVNCNEDNKNLFNKVYSTSTHISGDTYSDRTEVARTELDENCKNAQISMSDNNTEIITTDNISFYGLISSNTFGCMVNVSCTVDYWDAKYSGERLFGGETDIISDKLKLYRFHNLFCMDVDGINKGEDPFGYGIRVDGKILYGARADEWMQKSMQKGD